jgi:aspartate racemase
VKTIGLLGGMSWQSSIEYERIINAEVQRRLGGIHSADLLIRSYDFAVIEGFQSAGAWEEVGRVLAADAIRLQEAGADLILLCTNTMHLVADVIEAAIDVPFLHLADAVAAAVAAAGIDTVALLGTRFTMEMDFYRDRLACHGLTVMVPEAPDRAVVDTVIFSELVKGRIVPESRRRYLGIIDRMVASGAAGVIAGCTEIELLVTRDHIDVPYFPTTRIHAVAAVDAALAE